jgi:hypothetical protein
VLTARARQGDDVSGHPRVPPSPDRPPTLADLREAVDAYRAAMPKVPIEKILLHDERDLAALTEFVNRYKPPPWADHRRAVPHRPQRRARPVARTEEQP